VFLLFNSIVIILNHRILIALIIIIRIAIISMQLV